MCVVSNELILRRMACGSYLVFINRQKICVGNLQRFTADRTIPAYEGLIVSVFGLKIKKALIINPFLTQKNSLHTKILCIYFIFNTFALNIKVSYQETVL